MEPVLAGMLRVAKVAFRIPFDVNVPVLVIGDVSGIGSSGAADEFSAVVPSITEVSNGNDSSVGDSFGVAFVIEFPSMPRPFIPATVGPWSRGRAK